MSDRPAAWSPPPRQPPGRSLYGGFGRRFLAGVAVAVLFLLGEIALLIVIGRSIGWGWTLLLVLATSLLGAWVLRREGPRSWRAFRADLRDRRPPGASVTDGLLVLVGGLLMLLPGFVSDVLGAFLVAPPTRRLAAGRVQSMLTRRLSPSTATTLFGPRTVRARTGETPATPPAGQEPPIEGEIIDPSPPR